MATYHAIAAISQAIVRLLTDASKAEPDLDDAAIELVQPSDFPKTENGMGIAVFLYRVAANTTRRSLPPRVGPDGQRFRPSLPLDLYYLLVPWAGDAHTQQLLLGWAMRTLEDSPILPASLLNADEKAPAVEMFFPDETVELIYDPLSLTDLASLWDVVKPRVQAGATYVVRQVAVDSEVEIVTAEPVQTRELRYGKLIERSAVGAPS